MDRTEDFPATFEGALTAETPAKISRDDGPGNYQAHLTPDMTGDWSADIPYQGPLGVTKLTLPVNVKQ